MPKLCKRGKEAAKKVFKVYPSAYANGYAAQVCLGKKPGLDGKYKVDPEYAEAKRKKEPNTGLERWFKEKWVNVCEPRNPKGRHPPCGRKNAKLAPKSYPYCRPSVRVSNETPKTVGELTKAEIKRRCSKKRSKRQGKRGSPTYTRFKSKKVSKSRTKSTRKNLKEMPWIPVDLAKKFENYAKERGVSKVARGEKASSQSDRGFFEVYKSNGGNYKRLQQIPIKKGSEQNWRQRRNNFCGRHSAQMKKNNRPSVESTGKYAGLPTRQETGMIMWACSHLSISELRKMAKKL